MPSAKPVLSPLKTPSSATFPSELINSPFAATPTLVKAEDSLKTPITPPLAYLEFLKYTSPVFPSPGGAWKGSSGKSSPTSAPSTSSSECSCTCDSHKCPPLSAAAPSSPYSQPQSAPAMSATRRFRIPASPLCAPHDRIPMSANNTGRSPLSILSPKEFDFAVPRHPEPKSACSRPVSVRQVVTRTVIYKGPRVNIEPAPKGKRRKIE
jgi:hypothetical protein